MISSPNGTSRARRATWVLAGSVVAVLLYGRVALRQ